MAHQRPRYARDPIKKLLSFSPVVGVFGHRQVGKTTLIQSLENRSYLTLDLARNLQRIEEDPMAFVKSESMKGMTIDECQYSPALFPAIKEQVRINKRPGQFLLSGSVRFHSRKGIRESLTGRILLIELFPMNLTETEANPLNETVLKLMVKDLSPLVREIRNSKSVHRHSRFLKSLVHGGLPRIAFTREESLRLEQFDSVIDTVLERDLRLLLNTTLSKGSLRGLLMELARGQGRPLDLSELVGSTRISMVTLRKVLRCFEALYLIRVIETEGGERRPVIFLEDQGLATYLAEKRQWTATDNIIRGLFANLRPVFRYHPKLGDPRTRLYQYRTRGGALVPLCVRHRNAELGFIALPSEEVTRQAMGSAMSFLKNKKNSRVVFVHMGKKVEYLGPTLIQVPVGCLV